MGMTRVTVGKVSREAYNILVILIMRGETYGFRNVKKILS